MFAKSAYVQRRNLLKKEIESGIAIFLGNNESSMNYPANTYPFRQDSNFLYFFGIDLPNFAALIDFDSNEDIIFGDDFEVDDIVWMGPQKKVAELAKEVGVEKSLPWAELDKIVKTAFAQGRRVHFVPQYRHDNLLKLAELTGINPSLINRYASVELIKAIAELRLIKSDEEVAEIEKALDISYEMNLLGMKMSRPGIYEKEVAGAIEGVVLAAGSMVSFPIIFTVRGEVLHGHSHENLMEEGQLLVLDSGAESPEHYASDITRTFPVNGKFSPLQKDIYEIVLAAQMESIEMMKPELPFKEAHLKAAKIIAEGMKNLGFMKGDTDAAVEAGAHALFFPHGLGHPLGLDVHDLEGLGENYVGYDESVERSDQFGLAYLRFARKLKPGMVMTVEPGIYFMPELMAQWKEQNKHVDFINYEKVEETLGFGGIRIEDDVLVSKSGYKVLGKPIPKTVGDVEEACKR